MAGKHPAARRDEWQAVADNALKIVEDKDAQSQAERRFAKSTPDWRWSTARFSFHRWRN
ncbi:MAG: hypothetical protein U0361_21575 [Nitrospiraceae bacterium]